MGHGLEQGTTTEQLNSLHLKIIEQIWGNPTSNSLNGRGIKDISGCETESEEFGGYRCLSAIANIVGPDEDVWWYLPGPFSTLVEGNTIPVGCVNPSGCIFWDNV